MADLDGQAEIAVDTEADSFFSYREKVCLIQVTVEDRDYLVDPLSGVDISGFGKILADPKKLMGVIREELVEIRDTYGDKRRTEIVDDDSEIAPIDLVADEPMVVMVTRGGYVKRIPTTEYRVQARGGVASIRALPRKQVRGKVSAFEDSSSAVFVIARGANAEPMPSYGDPTLKAGSVAEAAGESSKPVAARTGLWGSPPGTQGFSRVPLRTAHADGSLSDALTLRV